MKRCTLKPGPHLTDNPSADFTEGPHVSANFSRNAKLILSLAGDEALVDTSPVEAPDRALALDPRQLGWLGAVFLVGLPALFALVGAALAWRRRRA